MKYRIVIPLFFGLILSGCATVSSDLNQAGYKNIIISSTDLGRESEALGAVSVQAVNAPLSPSIDYLNDLLREEARRRYKDVDAVINVRYRAMTFAEGILDWQTGRIAEGAAVKFINKDGQENTSSNPNPLPQINLSISSRPFHMGFTTFPPDMKMEAIQKMYEFIAKHGDMIVHHFDNGIPWVEAFEDREFSRHLVEDWRGKKEKAPAGHKIYVAITPLGNGRKNLAAYWGSSDNMPLPPPWNTYSLNDEHIKKAYLNYARRAIKYFKPDYFAIGIETNILLKEDRQKWAPYKELHKYIYTELKKEYPDLPIFASVSLSQVKGMDGANAADQKREVEELMPYNDILGVSTYPYGWSYWPTGKADPVPENFFDAALSFGKPIAIAETGAPSKNFSAFGINYRFDEDYQKRYIELLLRKAYEYKFTFVANWAAIDFERLLNALPPQVKEIGMIWAYTGLEASDGQAKAAVSVWDAYNKLPYEK